MNLCKCGCGKNIKHSWNQYVYQHQCRGRLPWNTGLKKTDHPGLMSISQKMSIRLTGGSSWNKGLPAWNRGLTKETNSSIKAGSEKLKSVKRRSGWHHSQASIEKMIKICREKYAAGLKPLPTFSWGHGSQVWCEETRKFVYVRSSWEKEYAKYLDALFVSWEYESYRFVLSTGQVYIPDFYLVDRNEFHEVKGYRSKEFDIKLQQFKQDFPAESIQIIDRQVMKNLGLQIQYVS